MSLFTREFVVGWADVDLNGHMRNTAYLDRSVDVRVMYLDANGFPVSELERLSIGPVLKREEVEYFRELRLLQRFEVTLALGGLSADAARFRLRNELIREDGTVVARVTSHGGWLDLAARKLTAPPAPLAAAFRSMPRTDDYAELR